MMDGSSSSVVLMPAADDASPVASSVPSMLATSTATPTTSASRPSSETTSMAAQAGGFLQPEATGVAPAKEAELPFIQKIKPKAVREDQVQAAVSFLKHPKVQGSPVKFRRSFLERKGLTADEIDEAFRRAPDPATGAADVDLTAGTGAATSAITRQAATPVPGTVQDQQQQQPLPPSPASAAQQLPPAASIWPRWAAAAVLLTAAGWGGGMAVQNIFIPSVVSWVKRVAAEEKEGKGREEKGQREEKEERKQEEDQGEGSGVAQANRERGHDSNEVKQLTAATSLMAAELQQMAATVRELLLEIKSGAREGGRGGELKRGAEAAAAAAGGGGMEKDRDAFTVADLKRELRGFARVMRDFDLPPSASSTDLELATNERLRRGSGISQGGMNLSAANGTTHPPSYEPTAIASSSAYATSSLTAASSPSSAASDAPPHPKSYMEIMEMVRRGETPPGIREIADKPPIPNRPISSPSLPLRAKPWESQHRPQQPASSLFGPMQFAASSAGPPPSLPPSSLSVPSSSSSLEDKAYFLPTSQPTPSFQPTDLSQPSVQAISPLPQIPPIAVEPSPAVNWVPPPVPSMQRQEAAAAIRNLPQARVGASQLGAGGLTSNGGAQEKEAIPSIGMNDVVKDVGERERSKDSQVDAGGQNSSIHANLAPMKEVVVEEVQD